jgi:1-acyl-sn-glycerol-3-phosphate acyltransferase
MTFLRSAIFNLFFFGVTAVMTLMPGIYLRLFAPDRTLDLARVWARIVLGAARVICGIRLEVSGLEHLAGDQPCLIASLHQSAFDTIVWLTLVPRCCYVVKHELLRIPLFGALLPITGMIAVDRSGGGAALRALLREGERAKREGRQIIIFPEGTRGEPDKILPLQPGVAALAARTRLPVFPVVTDSGRCWSRRAFRKRAGTIHIRILTPIDPDIGREALMQRLTTAFRSPVEKSVG